MPVIKNNFTDTCSSTNNRIAGINAPFSSVLVLTKLQKVTTKYKMCICYVEVKWMTESLSSSCHSLVIWSRLSLFALELNIQPLEYITTLFRILQIVIKFSSVFSFLLNRTNFSTERIIHQH